MPASSPQLFLVATPLGDFRDLSPRAREVLAAADLILCEDTRRTKRLLDDVGLRIESRLVALPGDREWDTDWTRFEDKERWVFVSDAGTPIVNDPGLALLKHFRTRGWPVFVVPGPSAPILALQWSGGFGLPFCFLGFVPKRDSLDRFFGAAGGARTVIYFDTRHQCADTLAYLEQGGRGESRLFVAREMTKPHEELLEGSVREIARTLGARLAKDEGIGEMTFVLEGISDETVKTGEAPTLDEILLIRSASVKDVAAVATRLTGLPKKTCYDALVKEAKK